MITSAPEAKITSAEAGEMPFPSAEFSPLTTVKSTEYSLLSFGKRLFSFSPRYKIFIGEEEVAEVLKRFTVFKPHYSVLGTNWEVQGDFFDHEYAVYDNNLPVATVRKEWLSWADTYSIDIAPYVDELTALCVVLIIDASVDTGELIQ